jgi:hypothetical protein
MGLAHWCRAEEVTDPETGLSDATLHCFNVNKSRPSIAIASSDESFGFL